jgi:hypothetical protein
MKMRNLFILLLALCGSLSSLWAQTSTVESNVFSVDTRHIFASNVFSVDTRSSYTVSFDLGAYGTHSGGGALVQTVLRGAAASSPIVTVADGWAFGGWSVEFSSVESDLTVSAQYGVPLAPVLELDSFYESNDGTALTVDASPTGGYPSSYSYQWFIGDLAIPGNFGGTDSSYQISGDAANDGTWKVKVTNAAGSTTVEFEYRVFADADGDGLSDYRETNLLLTDPNAADSDADGINDYDELHTHATDPVVADSDADGLFDGAELTLGTDPNAADSDDDGLSDGAEVNSHSTDPNDSDSDDDGLSDFAEVDSYATDPNDADSDDDGLSDAAEINTHGTDPNAADSDGDGLSDGAEVNQYASNPIASDTDGDGILDGIEVRLQAAAAGFDLTVDSSAGLAEFIAAAASVPGLLQDDQVEALRLGGIALDVAADGAIAVQFVIEESTDLSTWSEVETVNTAVDNGAGKKFIRVRKP